MAVYRRSYRPYAGALTSRWSRFLIPCRYALEGAFESRALTGYLVFCLVPSVLGALIIYLYNAPLAQALLGLQPETNPFFFAIDNQFFYYLLRIQGGLVFLLTAWIGPGLVAPDLTNGALPLYLSRPFSRAEYVAGKTAALFVLISSVTWAPDLLLFALQAGLAEGGWLAANLRVAGAVFVGSLIWIAVLSLLALALSAWVRWRIAATGLLVGIFFVSSGFGLIWNEVMRTYWGNAMSLYHLISSVWRGLFDIPAVATVSRVRVGTLSEKDIPVGIAWLVLAALCGVCLLLLNVRLRAREVVRG